MEGATKISQSPIVILGAGVIGLQTALTLRDAGLNVVIVAKDWPGSQDPLYTSTWSGAQWRSNVDIGNQQAWDRQTFLHWLDLVKNHSPETLGLQMKRAVFLWDKATEGPETSHWWTSFVPNFKVLSPEALTREGKFSAGCSYETIAICPSLYLEYLHRECLERGIECRTGTVSSLAEVFSLDGLETTRGLVNCTGLGAGALTPDPEVFPTKGQTVIVSGQAERIATRSGDGWEALVIPWPGTNKTLLGGCKIPGDWSSAVDDQMTQTILDRCKPIASELLKEDGEFEILAVHVGLRPSRNGGPRMEVEKCHVNGMERFICHCYGHYSAGYEGSVGIAREAYKMVETCLTEI